MYELSTEYPINLTRMRLHRTGLYRLPLCQQLGPSCLLGDKSVSKVTGPSVDLLNRWKLLVSQAVRDPSPSVGKI